MTKHEASKALRAMNIETAKNLLKMKKAEIVNFGLTEYGIEITDYEIKTKAGMVERILEVQNIIIEDLNAVIFAVETVKEPEVTEEPETLNERVVRNIQEVTERMEAKKSEVKMHNSKDKATRQEGIIINLIKNHKEFTIQGRTFKRSKCRHYFINKKRVTKTNFDKRLLLVLNIEEMKNKPYVTVTHKPTGRQYQLNRGYQLIKGVKEVKTVVSEWDGWTPNPNVIPAWALGQPENDFKAVWHY